MRYSAEHKEATRERIVSAAARRFRRGGGDGAAIADLMRDLKLTHGGFYRHFRSKEQLFAEAIARGFEEVAVRLAQAAQRAPEGRKLHAIIEAYLSDEHCAHPADGCPVAALASEIARHSRPVRLALDRAVEDYATQMAAFIPGRTAAERRQKALVLFSGMAGTLSLARAVADDTLKQAILRAGRESYIHSFCETD